MARSCTLPVDAFEVASLCSVCLNLEYDQFDKVPVRPDKMQTHRTKLGDIHSSAQKGCEKCRILLQGLAMFPLSTSNSQETSSTLQIEEDTESMNLSVNMYSIPGKPLLVGAERFRYEHHMRLEFYTEPDCSPSLPIFGHAREVPARLEFTRCISILKSWLQNCINYHNACAASVFRLPKRLIQISGSSLKLVSTEGLVYSHYMTLSHCWGKSSNMMKTTKGNIERRYAGILEDELPNVFKDAIAITRSVGCQWIWIDSLCIIQDDEDDWREQAAMMANIYSNSYLNIAATLSGSSYGSCFLDRKIFGDYKGRDGLYDMWSLESFPMVSSAAGLRVRVAHSRGHGYIADTLRKDREHVDPLLDRAWVFQERLLAPRNLHFESSEMIWECNSVLACECSGLTSLAPKEEAHNAENIDVHSAKTSGDVEVRGTLKSAFARACQGKASQQEILDLWLRMIELYSTLALTNLFDRTYALAGLSSRTSEQVDCTFLAGLWAADLPRGLLWSAWPRQIKTRKRLTPTFPTWSWMSQYNSKTSNSHVLFPENYEEFVQDARLQIHHTGTYCKSVDGNPFGGIESGQLDMTAAVMSGSLVAEKGATEEIGVRVGGVVLGVAWFDCPTDDCLEHNQDILCLYPGSLGKDSVSGMQEEAYALLLRPVPGGESYARIGILFLELRELGCFDYAEVRRVRVV
ncbi:heterokaryon incompatibility protein-domain-containing protein [Pyrenochaeta sp. MPI-SDFR-AT-0127]|nr:heterokaryon incompatibility protein-domain-containing protein [Pyrenochaeta sp. MPI-SDFR-AT-0127]